MAQPCFSNGQVFAGATIKLVEVEPLLAFQQTVDVRRSEHHCNGSSSAGTFDEVLSLCLPLAPQTENILTFQDSKSMILKSRSLNVRTFAGGLFNGTFVGIQFGVSLPYVQVVRYNGRCYLSNGFHRAYGLKSLGNTHIPCVFRDVNTDAEVGIGHGTFPIELLESENPPTLGHFSETRALEVSLRSVSRVLHVSWSEYSIPDE